MIGQQNPILISLSLPSLEMLEPRLLLSAGEHAGLLFGVADASWWATEWSSPAGQAAVAAAIATGLNTVELVPTWYQDTANSTVIYADSQKTAADDGLVDVIGEFRAAGVKVVLKPHVDIKSGAWRGSLTPADASAWFDSYTAFIDHYAQIAQQESVEILSVGTELASLSGVAYQSQWNTVIDSVKGVYKRRAHVCRQC